MNQRLFIGTYPAGIVYSDREKEVHGDYKRLAFLPYDTLKLEVERGCPGELEVEIVNHARTIQCQVGQHYRTSETGSEVLLGSKVKPVKLKLQGMLTSVTHEIIAFSMTEPSTYSCAFLTKDGQLLRSSGCLITYEGDIDALPPAFC